MLAFIVLYVRLLLIPGIGSLQQARAELTEAQDAQITMQETILQAGVNAADKNTAWGELQTANARYYSILTSDELDKLALKHEKIYPIASRCGVFAKSDIQPILNQGGRKEDVAASIFQAVVDQTIAGLTQGRELKGKIVFLGGPLHFLMGLRERFVEIIFLRFRIQRSFHLRVHNAGILIMCQHRCRMR